jgi:hypothetical protein
VRGCSLLSSRTTFFTSSIALRPTASNGSMDAGQRRRSHDLRSPGAFNALRVRTSEEFFTNLVTPSDTRSMDLNQDSDTLSIQHSVSMLSSHVDPRSQNMLHMLKLLLVAISKLERSWFTCRPIAYNSLQLAFYDNQQLWHMAPIRDTAHSREASRITS